jgi:hypothetical protein
MLIKNSVSIFSGVSISLMILSKAVNNFVFKMVSLLIQNSKKIRAGLDLSNKNDFLANATCRINNWVL